MLTGQLGMNNLPVPTFNNKFFYIVIMPSGLLTGESNAIGEHSSFFPIWRQYPVRVGDERRDAGLCQPRFCPMNSSRHAATPTSTRSSFRVGRGAPVPIQPGPVKIGDVCSSFALVGGVQVQSYWSKADKPLHHPANIINGELTGNPVLIQGRFLHPGNFEMACPLKGDGLSHYSR